MASHICRALALSSLLCAAAQAAQWPSLAEPTRQADRPGRQDGALIIAIEDYLMVEDVRGARANAEDWDRWFAAQGVPIARVIMLRDSEAVRESILRQATQLASEMPPGGTLWVVYIGHGAPSADGRDGVLVGADAQQRAEILYARSVGRQELVAALQRGRQAETVLVLDACFSGKGADGAALVPNLQPLIPVSLPAAQRVTILSAGAGSEFAGPLPGLARPAFSYLVLGALQGWREADEDADGAISLREAVGYSRGALRRVVRDRRQTPEISGPLAGRAFARASTPGPDLRSAGEASPDPIVRGAGSVADQIARLEAEQAERDREAALAARERARLEAERQREETRLRATIDAAAAATRTRAVEEWNRLTRLAVRDLDATRPALQAFVTQYRGAQVLVASQAHPVDIPEVTKAEQLLAGRSTEAATAALPARLSRDDILSVIKQGAGSVRACSDERLGTLMVEMVIEPDGHVSSARTRGARAGTPPARCLEARVRSFRFRRFAGPAMSLKMPFAL